MVNFRKHHEKNLKLFSKNKCGWNSFPVNPRSIDAVILTHAYIDHSGHIPLLVKNGFRGKILLPDSGFLQEEDAFQTPRTRGDKIARGDKEIKMHGLIYRVEKPKSSASTVARLTQIMKKFWTGWLILKKH